MSELIGSFLDTLKSIGKSGYQLGKSFVIDENGNVIPTSDISGAKVGLPSDTVNTVQDISNSGRLNRNLLVGTTGLTATSGFIALTATNPGVQQTTQSLASGFNSIASAGQNATNFLTTSQYGPILLLGGLALIGIVLLKK